MKIFGIPHDGKFTAKEVRKIAKDFDNGKGFNIYEDNGDGVSLCAVKTIDCQNALLQGADAIEHVEKIIKEVTKVRTDFDIAYFLEKLPKDDRDAIYALYEGMSKVKGIIGDNSKVGKAVQIDVPKKSMEKAREMIKEEAHAMANAAVGKPSVEGQWLAVRGCMDDRGDDCVILRVGHGIGITKDEYLRANAVIGIPQSDEHFLECVNKLNDEDGFPRLPKTFRYSEIKEYLKEDGPFYKPLKKECK